MNRFFFEEACPYALPIGDGLVLFPVNGKDPACATRWQEHLLPLGFALGPVSPTAAIRSRGTRPYYGEIVELGAPDRALALLMMTFEGELMPFATAVTGEDGLRPMNPVGAWLGALQRMRIAPAARLPEAYCLDDDDRVLFDLPSMQAALPFEGPGDEPSLRALSEAPPRDFSSGAMTRIRDLADSGYVFSGFRYVYDQQPHVRVLLHNFRIPKPKHPPCYWGLALLRCMRTAPTVIGAVHATWPDAQVTLTTPIIPCAPL